MNSEPILSFYEIYRHDFGYVLCHNWQRKYYLSWERALHSSALKFMNKAVEIDYVREIQRKILGSRSQDNNDEVSKKVSPGINTDISNFFPESCFL